MVLPLVPVMAATRPLSCRYPSSISPITAAPAALRSSTRGRSVGTPGLSTTVPISFITSSGSLPAIHRALLPSGSLSRSCSSVSLSLLSYSTASAPVCSKRQREPIPLMPDPTTRYFSPDFIPFIFNFLLSIPPPAFWQLGPVFCKAALSAGLHRQQSRQAHESRNNGEQCRNSCLRPPT